MGHRLEKNMRILDELVGFCCKRGASNIDININFEDKKTILTISGKLNSISQDDLEFIREELNMERQKEVEECYWVLNGDDSFGDELMLTGVMIDYADVTYENKIIKIVATRIEGK